MDDSTVYTNGGAIDHSGTLDCHDTLPQRLGGRPLGSCVSQRHCCCVADTYRCDSDVFAVYTVGRVTNVHRSQCDPLYMHDWPLCYHGGSIHRPHRLAVFESWITTPLSTPTGGEVYNISSLIVVTPRPKEGSQGSHGVLQQQLLTSRSSLSTPSDTSRVIDTQRK